MVLETQYPISFRKADAEKLGQFIKNRQPVAIIGMKRVGISNFLRFFLHHTDVIPTYVGSDEKHIFITVDLNDLVEREIYPFWVLTLKRIHDYAQTLPLDEKTKKHIESLFLNSIQSQELFLVIDNIKHALRLLIDSGYTPTLFFLRFDRLKDVITPEFFANLQGLKDALINRLSFVFTSYRSFDFLAPHVFGKATLTMFLRNMYLRPAESADMEIIYDSHKKHYHTNLSLESKSAFLQLLGGYVRYLQLALLLLQENPKVKTEEEFFTLFTFDERMTLQSEELWESFTKDEKMILQSVAHSNSVNLQQEGGQYVFNTGAVVKEEKQARVFSSIFAHFITLQEKTKKDSPPAEFTKKEQLLFDILKSHLNEICERETIIEGVWPEVEALGVSDWAIDRLVARVRNKLKLQEAKFEIQTIKTRGYKLISLNSQ